MNADDLALHLLDINDVGNTIDKSSLYIIHLAR